MHLSRLGAVLCSVAAHRCSSRSHQHLKQIDGPTQGMKRPGKRFPLSIGVSVTVAGRERRKRKWAAFDHNDILRLNRY